MQTTTATSSPIVENIPDEIRSYAHWVVYRLEERGGKTTKVPYIAGGVGKASATDLTTWRSFEESVEDVEKGRRDGVGFVFSSGDPYCGVDLDACLDPATEAIAPWATEIVAALASYTEITPSGRGLHIIVRGRLPPGRRRQGPIEMYDSGRFFTMTGHCLEATR